LLSYKNDIEILKSDLNLMRNKITNYNDETKSNMIPATENVLRDLMMGVTI